MPGITLVGANGRVGRFIDQRLSLLADGEFYVEQRISRDQLASGDYSDTIDWLLLAVNDDQIADCAKTIATNSSVQLALHFSGVSDASTLASLAGRGALTGSLHPVHSFSDPIRSASLQTNIMTAIEGNASDQLLPFCQYLNITPFCLKGSKARYHAATAMAANGAVALAAAAMAILDDSIEQSDSSPTASALLLPMMQAVLDKCDQLGPSEALTGPVQRGDINTVMQHIEALNDSERRLYNALSRQMLQLINPKTKAHQQIADIVD